MPWIRLASHVAVVTASFRVLSTDDTEILVPRYLAAIPHPQDPHILAIE